MWAAGPLRYFDVGQLNFECHVNESHLGKLLYKLLNIVNDIKQNLAVSLKVPLVTGQQDLCNLWLGPPSLLCIRVTSLQDLVRNKSTAQVDMTANPRWP